jgi:hypothetical protein
MREIRNLNSDPDDRPGPLALQILSAAVIVDLKDDADELAKLFAELDEHERERLMVLLFGAEV